MKFECWCLEGYEVYFNGFCKNSSVDFGTHDLTKQLYANLRIFNCKREDPKTSVFRGLLLSSHLTESNSCIAESKFQILWSPQNPVVCFSFEIFVAIMSTFEVFVLFNGVFSLYFMKAVVLCIHPTFFALVQLVIFLYSGQLFCPKSRILIEAKW